MTIVVNRAKGWMYLQQCMCLIQQGAILKGENEAGLEKPGGGLKHTVVRTPESLILKI